MDAKKPKVAKPKSAKTSQEASDGEFVTAREAAKMLGVSLATLYVYVGRKGLRSQPVPGSRHRRYSRADIERELRRRAASSTERTDSRMQTAITEVAEEGPLYRGQSAADLAETASFEEVAALLWGYDQANLFESDLVTDPANIAVLADTFTHYNAVDRAALLLPMLEGRNPRAFDLSAEGIARTGAELLRWLPAIFFGQPAPLAKPIHLAIASAMNLDQAAADLIRRVLILSADHGLEARTRVVRAAASTWITPWRGVAIGFLCTSGRRSGAQYVAVRSLVNEILDSPDPGEPIMRRLRAGSPIIGFWTPADNVRQDPRARAISASVEAQFWDDPDLAKIKAAVGIMHEYDGLQPDFRFIRAFLNRKLGFDMSDPVFNLGRAAGWIGHMIEHVSDRSPKE